MKTERKSYKVEGQMADEAVVAASGRGSVYIRAEDGDEGFTVAVDPDKARLIAAQLQELATLAEAHKTGIVGAAYPAKDATDPGSVSAPGFSSPTLNQCYPCFMERCWRDQSQCDGGSCECRHVTNPRA